MRSNCAKTESGYQHT